MDQKCECGRRLVNEIDLAAIGLTDSFSTLKNLKRYKLMLVIRLLFCIHKTMTYHMLSTSMHLFMQQRIYVTIYFPGLHKWYSFGHASWPRVANSALPMY